MLMLNQLKLMSALLFSACLVSCGGGSGNGGGGKTYVGFFYDSPTQGLSYAASPSGLTGTTDSRGAFNFRAGDRVTFAIPAGSGTSIPIGSVSPPTPASESIPAIVPVMSLPNGTQVAQILQTLGGSGPVINVTASANVLNSVQAAAASRFIASGGATTEPSLGATLVTASAAQTNAFQALATLPPQPLPDSLFNLVNGKVFFHSGTSQDTNRGLVFPTNAFSYTKSNGYVDFICVNLPYTTPDRQGGNDCHVSLGVDAGRITWAIVSEANHQIASTVLGSNPLFVDTITVSTLSNQNGTYSLDSSIPGLTSSGIWMAMQTSFSPASLSSKELVTSGHTRCTDGYGYTSFDVTGTQLLYNCFISRVDAGANTPVSGAVETTSIPGILKFTIYGKVYYVGLAVGGSLDDGTFIRISQGLNTCGTGFGFNLSDCGSAETVSVKRPWYVEGLAQPSSPAPPPSPP